MRSSAHSMPPLSPVAPAAILLVSAATLAVALLAQFWGGLRPCELCLAQRWPYVIAILLGAVGVAIGGRPRRLLVGLAGLAFLVGAGIAGYHVGVEQSWWDAPTACGGGVVTPNSLEALRQQLAATPVVRCDQPQWALAGITMAGFNFAFSLALAVATLVAARSRFGR